jgi:hypothetical protein
MASDKFYAIFEIDADDDAGFVSIYNYITMTWDTLKDAKQHASALRKDRTMCTYKIYECIPIEESK